MSAERIPELVSQIVAGAVATTILAYILLYGLLALRGKKAFSMNSGLEFVFGTIILVGIPAALTAFASLFVLPILLAIPMPASGWALGAMVGFAWSILAYRRSDSGMDGCVKILMTGASGYVTCMALWALVLTDPATIDVGTFVKPALLATPFAALAAQQRKGGWAKTLLVGAFAAVILALGFVPIEQGFASRVLPESPWLKFPIGGAVTLSMVVALPTAFMIVWCLLFKAKVGNLREAAFLCALFAVVGSFLGLIYAGLTVLGL